AGAISGTCNKSQTFTVTATDGCGNTDTETVTYTWSDDTENPVLTVPTTGLALGCNPATLPTEASVIAASSATDNCGATITASAGAISGTCNRSQTFTVTATDGCGNTDVKTVTYTWKVDVTPPTLTCPTNINVTNGAGICGAVVTFATPTASDNCGGSVTVTQTGGLASGATFPLGVSTVTFTATDECGNTSTCSFTVTVTQNTATSIVYTILAQEEIHTHRNYVYGNIGVWQAGKDVRIHEYSTISGFVQAPVIEKDNTSIIAGAQTLAMAPMPASSFLYNTQPDPSTDITVPDNYVGIFNLVGNNFRKITIGKNATAQFTSAGTIYIRELIIRDADVNKTTNLLFSGNSILRIRRTLDIGKRNNINQTGSYSVTMYVQENDVKVGASSKVNASIDVRFKNLLPQDALETNHTVFTGQYIAKKVDSKTWVDWNGLCVSGAPVPAASPAITGSSPTLDRQGNTSESGQPVMDNPVAFKVNVYPNPTRSQFTMQITGESNTPVMIRITDMAGRVQLVKTVNSNCVVTLGNNLTVGAYIAEVTQGNTRQLFKLIKAE
ncbi:MAG TPA: HYR domain-containing protein, partial [Chitinophagaceae bacterium]|nr:HYR domain-containing protein [Chitinophagaceae bacterium]